MSQIESFSYANQFAEKKIKNISFIKKLALFFTFLFIFSIPWGNAVWDGFTRVIGLGAFGMAVLVLVMHGTHKKYNAFHLFITLFGVWMLVSLMWSSDLVRGKPFLFTTIQLLLIPFLVTLIIDSKQKMMLAYQSYVLGTCIGSSIIIYNYINGIESDYYQRYGIPNFEVDGLSIMITLAIPMAAYLVTVYQNKWLKLIYTAAVPLIIYAVFLTGTRTAAIVAIIGVAYWLFTYRSASLRLKVSMLVLFMMSVVLVFSFAPKESVDRILTSGKSISSGTLNSRTVIWGASLKQWRNAPIVGNGIGSLGYVLSTEHVRYDSAHNTYIHILTENGLIGLSLYLFLIISILYYTLQTPLNQKSFLLALLMVILVSQITQHTHFHKETWFALTMLAIHAYAFSKRKNF
ncbi:MAG: O-antigen ligase family protein [Cocleimonas sp.]